MSDERSPEPARPAEGAEALTPPVAVPTAPAALPPVADSSVNRRSFFRTFSRQTVTTVAQVAGMAGAVQRAGTSAVVSAVGIGLGNPGGTPAPPSPLRDRGP